MDALSRFWTESTDYELVNLGLGLAKMAGGAALMKIAADRFGAPALVTGALAAPLEIGDLYFCRDEKWDGKFDACIYNQMGTSLTAQAGLRSFYKGLQYTTITLLLKRLGQGLLLEKDFSRLGLFKLGGYAAAASSPLLVLGATVWIGAQEWRETGNLTSTRPLTTEEKLLLLVGVFAAPIPFPSKQA
ncbi:MAG: hypothetical protein AB7F31_01420 [Parachlamydiales bacterium]